jgi:hypothetical protein
MAISNSVFGSNTLKFHDVIGVILVRKCDEKSKVRHQVMR